MADLSGLSDEQLQAYKDLLVQKQSPALKDAQSFSDRGGKGAPPVVAPPQIPKELRRGPVDQFGIPPSVKPLGGPVIPAEGFIPAIAMAGADYLDKLTHSGNYGNYHGLGGPILPPEGLSLPVGEGATSPLPGVGRFSNFIAPETHPALPEDLSMNAGLPRVAGAALRSGGRAAIAPGSFRGLDKIPAGDTAAAALAGHVIAGPPGAFFGATLPFLRGAYQGARDAMNEEPVYMGTPRDLTLAPSGSMGSGLQTGFGPSPKEAPAPVETGGAHIPIYVHPLPQPGEETELFRPATFAPSSRPGGTMGRGMQSGFGPSPKTMRPPVETGGGHVPDYVYRGTPPREDVAPEPVTTSAPAGTTAGNPVFGKSYSKPSGTPITGYAPPNSAMINARAFESQQNRLANAPITREELATLPIEELRKMVPHLSDEEFEQGLRQAIESGQATANGGRVGLPEAAPLKVRRRGVGQ